MNNFSKKLLIELAITFIIIFALGAGVWFFASNIRVYSEKIVSLRKEITRKSKAIDTLAKLRDEYNKRAKNALGILYSQIPLKDQLINLPREYRFLANQAGLGNYGFAFGDEVGPGENTLASVKFNINVSGNINQLLNFIKLLNQFRYLNTVDSISFTSQGDSVSMTVNGRVFFR